MKELRKYDIEIFKLKNGDYTFEFEMTKDFFDLFESDLVENGTLKAKISMRKSETLINMLIDVDGTVELTCDRSLETFDYPISTSNKILFKFGDHDEEVSDEILIIERNTQKLNLAQHIYDFIGLAIPMKKLHPRFADKDEDPDAEATLIYSSQELEDEFKDNKTEEIDPRWNALKNLKSKNK